MTKQQSIADQLANLQNSVKALTILNQIRERRNNPIKRILIEYDNSTTEIYELTLTTKPVDLSFGDEYTQTADLMEYDVTNEDDIQSDVPYAPIITTKFPHETETEWHKRLARPKRRGTECVIDGLRYQSIALAARSLGIDAGLVSKRLKDPQFPTWKVLND